MAMKLSNEFVVDAGIDKTWDLLNDLERVAPCLPGAAITGRDGDTFLGEVKIKVGPIGANLQGAARFLETDAAASRAVISMSGKDPKGGTATDATMHVQLEEVDGDHTRVLLDTDLEISGRMAQFGRGAIADVSNRLIRQFTDNLSALVAGETPSTTATADSVTAATPPRAAATQATQSSESSDLNILAVLGPTILRQAGPPVAGLLVGLVLGRILFRRGASSSSTDPWADARLNAWLETRLDARGLR